MRIKHMTFDEWDKEMDKITQQKLERDSKKSKGLLAPDYFQRLNQLLIAWDNVETNKSLIRVTWGLVVATWVLAIATIILIFLEG